MSSRYGRQLVLSGWTPELQARLSELVATVPGVGPRSEVCALYLVGAGVKGLRAEPAVAAAALRLDARLRLEPLGPTHSRLALGHVELDRVDGRDPVADGAAEAAALLRALML